MRREYLELPIILFEVLKVVPNLRNFEHVQKLRANVKLHYSAPENPWLTELAQVPTRRHLLARSARRL
jgi:hypothetical protein